MADLPHGKQGTDDLWDAMYTQRAIRYWQSKPVPRELLEKVIESASKAPSGSNLQPWVFIVIDDAVLLFYDSEFGSPQAYFENYGIDTTRVLHTPITNVEELKFDIIAQLEGLDRNDKVVIVIDSVGNVASKKELDDAINEKSVADMSRAKALKGLFRMTTPYLNMKNIYLLFIN